jgi:hypothetical protein
MCSIQEAQGKRDKLLIFKIVISLSKRLSAAIASSLSEKGDLGDRLRDNIFILCNNTEKRDKLLIFKILIT